MKRESNTHLFNSIAPTYGLFFHYQKKRYANNILTTREIIDLSSYNSIIDVGCGTGAFCSALANLNLEVTGIDPASKMLAIARKKTDKDNITFLEADVLDGLPFHDNQFDIAIASYVAHGMEREQRKKLYKEMSRIAKHLVIIHDYNKNRSPFTSLIEWLEGGDYFHFIKHAETEMRDCLSEMKQCFKHVEVLPIAERANWYICTPN
nr:class I SAM-dependent methyltransferase [uncultured Sphaerochaeta sp.]